MKRKTWAWVVLGGAALGIVLAIVTNRYFRPTTGDELDPNDQSVKDMYREFQDDSHPAKPSEKSLAKMREMAELGPKGQVMAPVLLGWLRRLHDEGVGEGPQEFGELAGFLRAVEPDAPKQAARELGKATDPKEREFQMHLLTKFGQAGVPALAAEMEKDALAAGGDFQAESQSPYPEALAKLGLDALPRLRAAVKHKEPAVRRQALRTLALMAQIAGTERTKDALEDVQAVLKDKDEKPSVRAFAALAWGELAEKLALPSYAQREALMSALNVSDPQVRLAAARTLAKHGSGVNLKDVAGKVDALLASDTFARTQWDVAEMQPALENVAVWKAQGAIKYSPLFWEETAAHVRLELSSQAPLSAKSIVDQLKYCPHDGRHLITLLVAQGEEAKKEVVPDLVEMLKDAKNASQRRKALLALGRLGKSVVGKSIDDVALVFESSDHGPTRWQAFLALVRLDPDRARAKLPDSLLKKVEVVRLASAIFEGTDQTRVSKWTGCLWRNSPSILVPILGDMPALSNGRFLTPIDRDIDNENNRIDLILDGLELQNPLGKEAVPFLLTLWQGTNVPQAINERHGKRALKLLAREQSAAEIAVPHLVKKWQYFEDIEPGEEVIHNALIQIGEGAVPYLAKILAEPMTFPDSQKFPEGKSVVDLTKRDLDLKIIKVLRAIGPNAKAAAPALVKAVEGPDEEVGAAAAKTFGTLGAAGKSAVPGLTKLLKDKRSTVRRYAAESLGFIGGDGKPAVQDLIGLFTDESGQVYVVVKHALKNIGKDAVQPLIKALGDPRDKVRLGAVETLTMMPLDAARPALTALQKLTGPDQPADVRAAAQDLIKQLENQ